MERTKELEKLALLEQKKAREDKHRQTRLTALKVTFLLNASILFYPSGRTTTTKKTI